MIYGAKYISLEKIILDTKETYYESLQAGSHRWHENKNDYLPFIRYCLGILIKACSEFESRVEYLCAKKLSKPERIKDYILGKTGKLTKKEILEVFPDISKITVERTLAGLVKEGFLGMIGAGPRAGYVKEGIYAGQIDERGGVGPPACFRAAGPRPSEAVPPGSPVYTSP